MIKRLLTSLVALGLLAVPASAGEIQRKIEIILGSAAFVGVDRFAELLDRQSGLGSIAELRAVRIDALMRQFPETVHLRGYTTDGDHSGVDYRYDASCVDTDTAGTVILPTVGVGCWGIVAPADGVYDARWFGVVADNSTDNATALARISTAGVHVRFPTGISLTSATWYPTRGFSGTGKDRSFLKATSTWLGGDFFIDVRAINTRNETFADLRIDGSWKMKYTYGTSDPGHTIDPGVGGFWRWSRFGFFGAIEYLFYFPDTIGSSGMETVGGVCAQCFFNGNFNSGLIYLGIASDDMTFINTRLEHFNGPGFFPVRIHSVNVSFINTFYAVGSDMDAGIDSLFYITSGGAQRNFENLFIEPSSITFTNWKYVFRAQGVMQASINGAHLEGNGPTLPSDSAFIRAEVGWASGRLEVRNLNNGFGGIGMTTLFAIDNSATQTAGKRQEFVFSGVNGFATLTAQIGTVATTEPRIHLSGTYGGIQYNTFWESDGTNQILTYREPTIVTADLDLIAANNDVARVVCPFNATIQRVETVIDGALVTANATVTVAIAGTNVTGGVVTVTQSGSAADDIDFAVPTGASNDNDCTAGQVITGTVGGGSTAGSGMLLFHFAPRAA